MSAIRDLVWDAIKGADHVLLALCVLANSFGILLIYSASLYKESFHTLYIKQAIAMGIGIVLFFVISQLDVRALLKRWPIVVVLCVAFQAMVKIPGIGVENGGNLAWVKFPFIPFNLQPAEINKIFFVILLAGAIVHFQQAGKLSKTLTVFQLVAILGFAMGLIVVLTSDYGSSLIYAFIWVFMLWCAGVKKRWFVLGGTAAAAAAVAVWRILPEDNHLKARFLVLFDHDYDPLGTGFQQTRAMAAIRSGGLTGQGYLNGTITQSTINTALTQRNSDFIFASCAEEWGLVGCLFLILLLAAIVIRCLYIAATATDSFSALVAVGYSGMLMAQIFLNIGMNLYVMPTIGLTLPFISNGGSSLITNYAIMGILSGIKSRSLPAWLRDRSDIKRD